MHLFIIFWIWIKFEVLRSKTDSSAMIRILFSFLYQKWSQVIIFIRLQIKIQVSFFSQFWDWAFFLILQLILLTFFNTNDTLTFNLILMFILRVTNCKQWTLNLWVLIAWCEYFVWSLMVRSRIILTLLNLNLYFTRMIYSGSQRINFFLLRCILIILNGFFSVLLFLLQYVSIFGIVLTTLLFVYKVNV